ncbi:ATPase, aaa-2 [Coniochaeta hoffmannii]|uniref:ATPase, aaa-2 n=1 Tax=Coniochaeta hoffmannii TaxID=91930 RepID=A0AA38RWY3_9PEZI|nr:ATPase, aaa-2 [Coniochaeta hoffmannii]
MAAAQVASAAQSLGPDADMVHFVMRECRCDENRARKLLATSKNDPHKAVSHQQKLTAMLARQGHSKAQSPATQPPAPAPEVRSPSATWHHAHISIPTGNGWATAHSGGVSGTFPAAGVQGQTPVTPAPAHYNSHIPSPPSNPERPPPPPPTVPAPAIPRRPVHSPPGSRCDISAVPTPSLTPETPSTSIPPPEKLGPGTVPVWSHSPPVYPAFSPGPAGPDVDISQRPPVPYQTTDGDDDTHMTDPPPVPEVEDYYPYYRAGPPTAPSTTRPPPEPAAAPPVPPPSVIQAPPELQAAPVPRAPAIVYSIHPAENETGVVPAAPVFAGQTAYQVDSQQTTVLDSTAVDEPQDWDFRLPLLPEHEALAILAAGRDNAAALPPGALPVGGSADFNLRQLCAAVQHGADVTTIQKYLREFTGSFIKRRINGTVEGVPSIFYAVQTDEPAILRLWAGYGANISAVHPPTGTPLLAYAIVLSDQLEGRDTSPIVATLLSLGASPKCIPTEFYAPYNRDLPEDGVFRDEIDANDELEEAEEDEDSVTHADVGSGDEAGPATVIPTKEEWRWCSTPAMRIALARTANLTQRYYLDRATKLKRAGVRHRQIAALRNAEAILGIPYYLIGQTIAANRLLRKLLTYITVPSKKPLVLAFAGPSGHGKTELARKLGYLLGLELQVVDCTIVNTEKELFGPRAPYVGSERGSPLNNFIAHNAGRRSIVFLDEFEKTSREIHQSLLLPFDNGEYQDRRSLATIDCSRTIWILATNALDDTIIQFCGANPAILQQGNDGGSANGGTNGNGGDDDAASQRLAKKLATALRAAFLDRFGAPVTGRVSDFIPFLPFSRGEQAVVVHKFLLEMAGRVRDPVRLRPGPEADGEQLLGNVRLRVRRDTSVCARLAETEYSEELGARSLRKAVEDVQDRLVESYLDEDREIEEGEGEGLIQEFVVDVKGDEVVVSKWVMGDKA